MRTFKGMIGNAIMHILSILPLQDKVVFCSFGGKNYDDNPGVMYREFLRQHPELKYVWIMQDPNIKIEGAKVAGFFCLKSLFHLATAKLWIDNSRKREWIYKRKNQYYVQTWHGDVCIKMIEKDAANQLDETTIIQCQHDSKIADLMLSGSDFRTANYKSSFWYTGEILEYGTPKSEVFYMDPKPIKDKVKKAFGFYDSTKIALYCPTFRSDDSLDAYDLDYHRLLEELIMKWPGEWKILVRLHPKQVDLQSKIRYTEEIINATNYSSTDELIISSDIVITDYSGCMFSGLEARKRVLLYASDLDEYIKHERGLYFDIRNMPFPLAETNEEMRNLISNFDDDEYEKRASVLRKQIGFKTTLGTTNRIVDELYSRIWRT